MIVGVNTSFAGPVAPNARPSCHEDLHLSGGRIVAAGKTAVIFRKKEITLIKLLSRNRIALQASKIATFRQADVQRDNPNAVAPKPHGEPEVEMRQP